MSAGGWFAVARGVFAHGDVRRGPLCDVAAWLELVSRAAYRDSPRHDPPLARGQLVTTAGALASAWGWERGEVRNALARWERAGLIECRSLGRATLVTVVGFERWQGASPASETTKTDAPTVRQPCANRAPKEASVSNGLQDEYANRAPTVRQPCATIIEQENKEQRTRATIGQAASPLGDASAPPDPSTKAGRARLYPPLAALPREGTRYVYPEPFERFRAAYPDSARRAPGPATYRDWRALVVAGADPEALVRAATGHAIESGGKFARRAHGPSGWLRSGEWEALADAAPRDPLRAANPHAEHHETATAEHVAPVVEALPETGCEVWQAVRAELEQVLPVAAACVGCVEGGDLVIRTRDEIAELALRKRAAIVEAVASQHWAGEIRIVLV